MSTDDTQHDDVDLVPVDLQVKPLADELEEVRAKIKGLQAREKELTLEVRALVDETDGTYGPVTVSTPRQLDADKVAAAYPVETHPYLWVLKVDPAKVKAHLSPEQLETFKTSGTPRVSVRR